MKTYKLKKHGPLFVTKACVVGPHGMSYPNLLLDTGSAHTIIAQEIIYSIGYNFADPERSQRIITGSGYEIVPVVSVSKFYCLGQEIEHCQVLAHTLPFGVYVDGLLGMDFLSRFDVVMHFKKSRIIIG